MATTHYEAVVLDCVKFDGDSKETLKRNSIMFRTIWDKRYEWQHKPAYVYISNSLYHVSISSKSKCSVCLIVQGQLNAFYITIDYVVLPERLF